MTTRTMLSKLPNFLRENVGVIKSKIMEVLDAEVDGEVTIEQLRYYSEIINRMLPCIGGELDES